MSFSSPYRRFIFASFIARTSARSCMICRSLACLAFLVYLLFTLLSQHPLPNVRRTAQYRDFFFSSRRRNTRWNCDWSSDVCSSDLVENELQHPDRDDQRDPDQQPGDEVFR